MRELAREPRRTAMAEAERAILKMCGEDEPAIAPFIAELQRVDQRVSEARQAAEEALSRQAKKRRRLTCVSCRNEDESKFEEDEARGQVTCMRCGTCVVDSAVQDTEWVRQYEGEENPSFHGPPPDDKFSNAHNLRTGFGQDTFQPKTLAKELSLINQKIFNGESDGNANKEKKTSQGYKDKRKAEAMDEFRELGDKLQLHERVIERAAMLFAQYRQETERVGKASSVKCAALVLALREASIKELGIKRQRLLDPVPAAAFVRFECQKCHRKYNSKKEARFCDCAEEG